MSSKPFVAETIRWSVVEDPGASVTLDGLTVIVKPGLLGGGVFPPVLPLPPPQEANSATRTTMASANGQDRHRRIVFIPRGRQQRSGLRSSINRVAVHSAILEAISQYMERYIADRQTTRVAFSFFSPYLRPPFVRCTEALPL